MRRTILLLALATALFVDTAGAQEPRKPESSASGVLRITADGKSGLADERLVTALATTRSVLNKAVSKVSKEAAAENSDVALVEWTRHGVFTLIVKSYDQRVPADKLLEALTDAISDKVRDLDVAHRQDQVRADRLMEEVHRIKMRLETEYSAFAKLAANHGVSTDAELSAQKQVRLEAELQSLKVQSQGLRARQKILEHQIAELGEKVAGGAGADPAMLKELMKSIEARMKIVAYRRAAVNKGVDEARADLEQAQDALAKAQYDLARFRRDAAKEAGVERIEELKRRLDDTAIALAENSARSDAVQKQLAQAQAVSSSVEIKRLDVERLKQDYRDASDELSKLRRKLGQYFPPAVALVPLQ